MPLIPKPISSFFGVVEGSAKGVIVPEELYRSILAALGSGSLIGLAIMVVQSISAHAATIFPNASVAGLVTVIGAMILDLLRRQQQGEKPAGLVVVTPAEVATPPASSKATLDEAIKRARGGDPPTPFRGHA